MDERNYVLCQDIKDRISKKFIENGWITVSDIGIHSALVTDENVLEVLGNYCWDLPRGDGMPGVSVRYVNKKPIVNYDRLGHNKCEPFVFIEMVMVHIHLILNYPKNLDCIIICMKNTFQKKKRTMLL